MKKYSNICLGVPNDIRDDYRRLTKDAAKEVLDKTRQAFITAVEEAQRSKWKSLFDKIQEEPFDELIKAIEERRSVK